MKDMENFFLKLIEKMQKGIGWFFNHIEQSLRMITKSMQKPLDWKIVGSALCFFVILSFSELLYIHFFAMRFHASKMLVLVLYSVFFSFVLSLVKKKKLQRGIFCLIVFFISCLYFGEATYFAIFKRFALWSEIARIGDLLNIQESAGNFMHYEFYVFFIPSFFVLVLTFSGVLKKVAYTSNEVEGYRLSKKERRLGTIFSFIMVIMVTVYYTCAIGDMNKFYLKNSVEYVNRYSLIDAFGLNSVQSLLPVFKEWEPTKSDIDREFLLQHEKNEKTDLYKDKNLIFIEGESIAPFAIDPILTPTLYQMQKEGYNFNNYYSPRANTLNSEYAIMNSFYLTPEKDNEPFNVQDSMARLFKKSDYSTQVFHDFYDFFYNRAQRLPQSGFDAFYDLKALDITLNSPDLPLDFDLFANSFPYIEEKDRFLAYYITMTGHSGYELRLRPSLFDNLEHVKARFPDYSLKVQIYLAAAMGTDQGVKKLYEDLTRSGKLADTVIVFVGDHYPYGVDMEELQATFNIERQLDVYKTPFIIWDASHPAQTRDNLMSNVDVLPTLANLFGLNLRYGMGQDVFSHRVDDVIVEWYDFRAYSFLVPKGGYDGLLHEVIGDLTPEQIHTIQQRMYERDIMNNSLYLRKFLAADMDVSKAEMNAVHLYYERKQL